MTLEDKSLPIHLDGLRFKGDRSYLHGTDILENVLVCIKRQFDAPKVTDIDISFHGKATTGLTLLSNLPEDIEPVARLTCKIDGLNKKFFIAENGSAIVARYEYTEEQIVAVTDIHVGSASATTSATLAYTDIERWIAMVKALHLTLFPQASGKWLFVRGKFDTYVGTLGRTKIEHRIMLEANFNGKLTRSGLYVGGRKLGLIFFALS